MAPGHNSLYSQGFNFSSYVEKGVDARTGQYTSSITLYESPAKARNCVSFTLSLNFSPLNTENCGFGTGWSLNLSQYHHAEPRLLFLSTGEHYRVTQTGGALHVEDQKLKSFKFQQKGSDFEIIHKDGRIEVLSNSHNIYNASVPVKLYAANGRSLTLTWTAHDSQPRLSKVQDGDDVLLSIHYGSPYVEITRAPDSSNASKFTLVQQENKLGEFRLPLEGDPKWKFEYESFDAITCISKVRTPEGLVEQAQYKAQGHRLPSGGPYEYIPYVIEHTAQPGNDQPAIRTLYSYSSNNFFGFGGVGAWKQNEDNLYHAIDNYQYTSTVSISGGQTTRNTYNRFHLLVESYQHLDEKEITQRIEYNIHPNVPLEHQPAQFQLPKTVTTTYRDINLPPAANTNSRDEVTRHEFDEWGNPLMDIQADGLQTTRAYYPPGGEQGSCPADPHGFPRYLREQTVSPSGQKGIAPVRSTRHTYVDVPTATGAPVASFVLAQKSETFEDGQSISTIDRVYYNAPDERDHGRLQQQTTKLSDNYPMVQSWTYEYADGTVTESQETLSFDNHSVKEQTGYCLDRGLTVSHVDKTENSYQFEYDPIGRQVSATFSAGTPYEATRKSEYAVADETAGYIMTVTDVKGAKTRYTTDGLQRVCKIEQQDDDGTVDADGSYTGTFRVVHEKIYNEQGQCSQTHDIDWMRIADDAEPEKQTSSHNYEYDGWGYVSKITDSNGVVTEVTTEPVTYTYTEGIENQGKIRAKYEGQDILVQKALLKSDGTPYSNTDYTNDGLGRKTQEQDSLGGATRYMYDCFDRVSQTTFADRRIVKTQYPAHSTKALAESVVIEDVALGKQSLDGLERVTDREVGGRRTVLSYDGIQPKSSSIETPQRDRLQMNYNPVLDYALTSVATRDESNSYTYDHKTGDTLQSQNALCSEAMTYLPSGRLASETISIKDKPTSTTEYKYSMNGRLQHYKNFHGQSQALTYDEHGRLRQLTQGPLNVTLGYDATNRLSQTSVNDTQENKTLTSDITYDEFGREVLRNITQDGTLVYSLSQTYDVASRLESRELKDGSGDQLRHETFAYDNMGRLIDYQCQGEQAPVDHRGRKIQSQLYSFTTVGGFERVTTRFQDGSQNTAMYSYARDDPSQLISIINSNPDEPSHIALEYDDNGYLIRDEQGRKLEYDPAGYLTSVKDSNGECLSRYQYDSQGRLLLQQVPGKPDFYLHYRGTKLIAASNGDTQISYVSDGHQYWGQILQQNGQSTTQLWATDSHQSTLASLDTAQLTSQHYTPYGSSPSSTSIAWNGQWRDPVTGWYHLGNGNRVYNPILMTFHSPDISSPFTSGETNPYTYCLSDPINRLDPTGYLSIFGIEITWRDLVQNVLSLSLQALAAVLTDGASLAIEASVDIAAGVAGTVIGGAAYDVVSGDGITLGGVWKEFYTSAIMGSVSRGFSEGAKGLFKALGKKPGQVLTGAVEEMEMKGEKTAARGVAMERLEGKFEVGREKVQTSFVEDRGRSMSLVEDLRKTRGTRLTFDGARKSFTTSLGEAGSKTTYGTFRSYVKDWTVEAAVAAVKGEGRAAAGVARHWDVPFGGGNRVSFGRGDVLRRTL